MVCILGPRRAKNAEVCMKDPCKPPRFMQTWQRFRWIRARRPAPDHANPSTFCRPGSKNANPSVFCIFHVENEGVCMNRSFIAQEALESVFPRRAGTLKRCKVPNFLHLRVSDALWACKRHPCNASRLLEAHRFECCGVLRRAPLFPALALRRFSNVKCGGMHFATCFPP